MAKSNIVKLVREMAEPIADELGYELVDVEYVKEGQDWHLRIYIDKPGGISIDDCTLMNSKIDPLLDEKDIVSNAYIFEVSSPGLDRPLKTDRDFEKYKGEEVEVNLYKAIDGTKHFEGELIGRQDGLIKIEIDKEEMIFPQESVAVIRRTIKF